MKNRTLLLISASLALSGGVSCATVYRALTGDATTINANWSASEGGNSFAVVTNGSPLKPWIATEHFAGSSSVAFQVITNLSGDTERVEYKILQAADTNGLHFDNARYSGFAFKLAAPTAPFASSTIFWQAWQGAPWGPPAMLKFATDSSPPYRIRLTIRNMTTGPDSTNADFEVWAGSVIQPDTWYSVVVYLAPRLDASGNIKLWINGTNQVNWSGQIGYDPAQVAGTMNGLDIKNGIYQPDANNGHTFYFDQIKVADTFAEASPVPHTNRPVLSRITRTNNMWSMSMTGNAGALCTVQASTNLAQWIDLTATNPTALPFLFQDAANFTRRFYRIFTEP